MTRSLRAHLLGLAVLSAMLPTLSGAESLPASVRACAAETDSLRRLTCYDREVARYMEPKSTSPATPRHDTGTVAAAAVATPPVTASTAASTAQPKASAPTTPVAAPAAAAKQPDRGTQNRGHISAHVVSIDHSSDEMVLQLDNGQAWEELQSISGDLSLQVGDTVEIDKHFGSYWLSGPHVSGMKVRQKT